MSVPWRGEEQQPETVPELGDLGELAVELAGSLDPNTVVEHVLRRGLAIAKADRATLSSIEGGELTVVATHGKGGDITWIGRHYDMSWLTAQPIVRRALESLRPTLGGRLDVSRAAPEFRAALEPVRHTAILPLAYQGRPVGLLVLSRFDDRAFRSPDVPGLAMVGTIAGFALRNALLHREVEQARAEADETAGRLRVAIAAAEEVASALELEEVLRRLLNHAIEGTGADGGSLARVERDQLVIEATATSELVGTRWPIAPPVLEGIRQGRPVQLTAGEYTGTPPGMESVISAYRRFLVAPLVVAGEVVGLFALGFKEDRPFEEEAIAALQQFSTLAGLLLRNARSLSRAREAERAKSEFMDTAVHEMRAPLSVAAGYLAMSIAGDLGQLDPKVRTALEVSVSKVREAVEIAEELLSAARLEGGVLTLALTEVDAEAAARAAAQRATARANLSKGSVEVSSGPPVKVRADPEVLARALDNLVNNAILYVDGPPRVTLTVGRNGAMGTIAVRDNGPGVPEGERETIFGRFVRGRQAQAGGPRGTGLGLYLSRAFAERMGGNLRLTETGPGKGSTFLLSLPLA